MKQFCQEHIAVQHVHEHEKNGCFTYIFKSFPICCYYYCSRNLFFFFLILRVSTSSSCSNKLLLHTSRTLCIMYEELMMMKNTAKHISGSKKRAYIHKNVLAIPSLLSKIGFLAITLGLLYFAPLCCAIHIIIMCYGKRRSFFLLPL